MAVLLLAQVDLVLPPPPLAAQELPGPALHRKPRKKVLAILGAVIGAGATFAFLKAAKSNSSGCGTLCPVVGGAAIGAVAGFFIGREFDDVFAARFDRAAPLRIPNLEIQLEGDPLALAAQNSAIAVASTEGVEVFHTGDIVGPGEHRARGLRGITAIDIAPKSGWLSVGSPSGLYQFPPLRGPGSLVREGTVTATAASPTRIYFAVGDRIESAPYGADTTRGWPGITLAAPARTLGLDQTRGILWAATDRALLAFNVAGDSLAAMGTTPLDATPEHLALDRMHVAVAMGEAGVRLFDVGDPAMPRLIISYTKPRYSYDVSLDSARLFVAAGPEGLYVADLVGSNTRTLGLARTLGFASAVRSLDGYTYILDRRANVVRRIRSLF